jgi:hypothetical protein
MRRNPKWLIPVAAAVAAAVALVLVLGRGSAPEPAAGPLDDALGYFARDGALVAAVDTDESGPQWEALRRLMRRVPAASALTRRLTSELDALRLRFDRDVGPQLGNPLVLGVERNALVAAIRVRRPSKAKQLMIRGRFLPGDPAHGRRIFVDRSGRRLAVAVDGRVLVAGPTRDAVARALGHRRSPGRMREADFDADLAGLPRESVLRASADPRVLLAANRRLRPLVRLRWVAALRRAAAIVRARKDGLSLRLRLRTDPSAVRAADLPLAPGRGERIPLIGRDDELAVGVREPARLVRFLSAAFRVLEPRRARRVARVGRRIRRQGIDLERDIVARLGSSAALALDPVDRSWAARAVIRQSDDFRQALAALADSLPELAAAFGMPGLGVATPDLGASFFALARRSGTSVVFGVIGASFVAASEPRRAAALVSEPTRFARGADGALVATVDARKLAQRALAPSLRGLATLGAPFLFGDLGDLTASISIDRAGLYGRAQLTLK